MTQNVTPWFEHLPKTDHYCLLYDSQDQQFSSIVPFIEEGLESGNRCLYLVHDNTKSEVRRALNSRMDIDPDHVTIRDASDVYLSDGSFDPDQMIAYLESELSEAIEAGYAGLRVTGETSWAVEHDVDLELLKTYEHRVNSLFPEDSLVAVCQYRRSDWPSEFLCDILQSHPQLTHRSDSRLNSFYKPSTERSDADEIDRKLKTISDQNQLIETLVERNECLSLLGKYTEQLRQIESNEIEQTTADIVSEYFDATIVQFWEYSEDTGELEPDVLQNTTQTDAPNSGSLDIWKVYAEDEVKDVSIDSSLTGVLLPLDRHGVLLVASHASFTDADIAFLKSIGGHTEAALDQLTYERKLEQKNATLREKNENLERINQINTVIRGIGRSLVDASREVEIHREVCERLVRETDAAFAWYGTFDAGEIEISHRAGEGKGYLDALTVDESHGPAELAADSQEIVAHNDINDGRPLDHWQKQALKRGFRSVISLPVEYDGSLYGVLSVYSETPNSFTGDTAIVLDELTDLVAYALTSLKRKKALVTEAVTELELKVESGGIYLIDFVDRTGATVEIDDIVSKDSGFRLYVTIRDSSPKEIRRLGKTSPTISELEVLSSGDSQCRGEIDVTDDCFMARLVSHNAIPQSVRVEDGTAHLVLHLPRETGVRDFVEMLEAKISDVDIVGRRNREEALRQLSDIEAKIGEKLTERQLEMLKVAYHSGYFDQPRGRTAEEIAESIDVSHATVTRHLREAERRIFSMFFDTEHI